MSQIHKPVDSYDLLNILLRKKWMGPINEHDVSLLFCCDLITAAILLENAYKQNLLTKQNNNFVVHRKGLLRENRAGLQNPHPTPQIGMKDNLDVIPKKYRRSPLRRTNNDSQTKSNSVKSESSRSSKNEADSEISYSLNNIQNSIQVKIDDINTQLVTRNNLTESNSVLSSDEKISEKSNKNLATNLHGKPNSVAKFSQKPKLTNGNYSLFSSEKNQPYIMNNSFLDIYPVGVLDKNQLLQLYSYKPWVYISPKGNSWGRACTEGRTSAHAHSNTHAKTAKIPTSGREKTSTLLAASVPTQNLSPEAHSSRLSDEKGNRVPSSQKSLFDATDGKIERLVKSPETRKRKTKSRPKRASKTKENADIAKNILSNKIEYKNNIKENREQKLYFMRQAYQEQLRIWGNKNSWWKIKNWRKNDDTHLLKAIKVAEKIGMDYDTYVRAQFWWYDAMFNTRAKIMHMAVDNRITSAKERALIYLESIQKGDVNPKRAIKSPVRKTPGVSKESRFLHSEQTLKMLMKNYKSTDEEIFRIFAKGKQAYMYFDRVWLQQNETYIRLKTNGEI